MESIQLSKLFRGYRKIQYTNLRYSVDFPRRFPFLLDKTRLIIYQRREPFDLLGCYNMSNLKQKVTKYAYRSVCSKINLYTVSQRKHPKHFKSTDNKAKFQIFHKCSNNNVSLQTFSVLQRVLITIPEYQRNN